MLCSLCLEKQLNLQPCIRPFKRLLTTSGIGASIARIFLEASSQNNLVVVSRSRGSLDELVAKYGERLEIVTGDVCDSEVIRKAIATAVAKYGSLNSVVANAGVIDPVSNMENADIEGWKKLFDINLFSVVQLIQLSIPLLRKSQGNIVVVLSGASTKSYHGWGAYGASKAALNHVIATVVAEDPSISAISIAPGVVATDMQKEIRDVHSGNMLADAEKFKTLHETNQLLPPDVPATVYANLAMKGWSKDINGKYLRFDDASLKEYGQ